MICERMASLLADGLCRRSFFASSWTVLTSNPCLTNSNTPFCSLGCIRCSSLMSISTTTPSFSAWARTIAAPALAISSVAYTLMTPCRCCSSARKLQYMFFPFSVIVSGRPFLIDSKHSRFVAISRFLRSIPSIIALIASTCSQRTRSFSYPLIAPCVTSFRVGLISLRISSFVINSSLSPDSRCSSILFAMTA